MSNGVYMLGIRIKLHNIQSSLVLPNSLSVSSGAFGLALATLLLLLSSSLSNNLIYAYG
jgi:hypothetical protein